MNYILFDPAKRDNLFPINAIRPVASIRVGMLTIQEKWETFLKGEISVLVPNYLAEKYIAKVEEKNLYINASLLPKSAVVSEILILKEGHKLMKGDELIAFYGGPMAWNEMEETVATLTAIEAIHDVAFIRYTWNIIEQLNVELKNDFNLLLDRFKQQDLPEYTTAIVPEKILMGNNVKLGACILNASDGPIVIDDIAEIMDGAMVKGPIYLGKNSCIKMGAKIYGPVSIGEHCKVGGEVIDTVFQAYSNKGHDGFLGHSYIGEWCNLGADTTISNLKNTYDPVRLWNYAAGGFDHTKMQFLGLIMGDHSKTGINTMINSGTVIGVACNVYGSGFPRNFIPDFSSGSSRKMNIFLCKDVFKMARAMMNRRNLELSEKDEKILSWVFENIREMHP
ncbi:MAG: putative sugar nucleotidyl transferase [Prolixibacteraceae bacterium]